MTTEKTESADGADDNVLDELKHQAESGVVDQQKN